MPRRRATLLLRLLVAASLAALPATSKETPPTPTDTSTASATPDRRAGPAVASAPRKRLTVTYGSVGCAGIDYIDAATIASACSALTAKAAVEYPRVAVSGCTGSCGPLAVELTIRAGDALIAAADNAIAAHPSTVAISLPTTDGAAAQLLPTAVVFHGVAAAAQQAALRREAAAAKQATTPLATAKKAPGKGKGGDPHARAKPAGKKAIGKKGENGAAKDKAGKLQGGDARVSPAAPAKGKRANDKSDRKAPGPAKDKGDRKGPAKDKNDKKGPAKDKTGKLQDGDARENQAAPAKGKQAKPRAAKSSLAELASAAATRHWGTDARLNLALVAGAGILGVIAVAVGRMWGFRKRNERAPGFLPDALDNLADNEPQEKSPLLASELVFNRVVAE